MPTLTEETWGASNEGAMTARFVFVMLCSTREDQSRGAGVLHLEMTTSREEVLAALPAGLASVHAPA
jgi:hypothetical protein